MRFWSVWSTIIVIMVNVVDFHEKKSGKPKRHRTARSTLWTTSPVTAWSSACRSLTIIRRSSPMTSGALAWHRLDDLELGRRIKMNARARAGRSHG